MTLLQLDHVSRHFGDVRAVNAVSLDIQAGQFVTLLGASGCGKTTTLRLIAGFETPDSGMIRLKNQIVADASKNSFVSPKDRRVGMVFQDYALFPHLTVAQNIAFGIRDKKSHTVRVRDMLELVGLGGYDGRMPHELSGGQQQRVALARALAPQPDVLLLDEPFSNLDAALRAQVRSEMRSILRQANTTCIFVTHSQEEALSLSDLVVVMFEGNVVQIAPPQELYERPVTPQVAAFVGEANLIDADAHGTVAECVFGRVILASSAQGQVKLLIRPEMLRINQDASIEQTAARVLWREYYGHDQRVGLLLPDGTTMVARLESTRLIEIGQNINLTVQGEVVAYS